MCNAVDPVSFHANPRPNLQLKLRFPATGVAAINQYIYVVGGYDGTRQLNTVERYDTEKDTWEFVSSMKIARSALSVTVLDCKIYAMGKKNSNGSKINDNYCDFFVGGYDGQNFLANVEVYNPITDVWEDGYPLTSGRSGHASAVCYQTPCMQTCPALHGSASTASPSPKNMACK